MEDNKKLVTILIPAYNEQEALPILYKRLVKLMDSLPQYNFELLFVNDGSRDKTLEILKEMRKSDSRVCYVNLSRNYGKEVAMIAGFDYVNGDCMINIDADLQDPPELIPEMLKYWEEGYDDVYAKRKSRKGESILKKLKLQREEEEENSESQKYTDRSAQLRATLNSLAMMNVANVINSRKKALEEQKERERNSSSKDSKREELEKEFYNIAREMKEDKE